MFMFMYICMCACVHVCINLIRVPYFKVRDKLEDKINTHFNAVYFVL